MCSQNLETASTYCARLVFNLFMQCSCSTKIHHILHLRQHKESKGCYPIFASGYCSCLFIEDETHLAILYFFFVWKFNPRWTQLLSPANGSTPSISPVSLNGSEKWRGSLAENVKSQRRWIPSEVDLQETKPNHNENNHSHIPKGRKILGTTDPIQAVEFHGKQNGRECGLLIHSTTLEDQGTWRWECLFGKYQRSGLKDWHFWQKWTFSDHKKWHFEWPNRNSKTTFIVQTFSKYGLYDFYYVNL